MTKINGNYKYISVLEFCKHNKGVPPQFPIFILVLTLGCTQEYSMYSKRCLQGANQTHIIHF